MQNWPRFCKPSTTSRSDDRSLTSITLHQCCCCQNSGMTFSLSQAADLATDVGVPQFCVKSVRHAFLCLEVTGSSKHLGLRLSDVSSSHLPCGVSQRYLFFKWSWWHPGLTICVLSLDWCSGPPDDEPGSDGRSADGTACFPSNLLGIIAPAMNYGKSFVGSVCNNFGVTRRLLFFNGAANGNGTGFLFDEDGAHPSQLRPSNTSHTVQAVVTFLQPQSECIPSYLPKHKQVPMSDELVVTIDTTLLMDAPIDCPMGLLSQVHSVASTPVLLQDWQCVIGCDVTGLMT